MSARLNRLAGRQNIDDLAQARALAALEGTSPEAAAWREARFLTRQGPALVSEPASSWSYQLDEVVRFLDRLDVTTIEAAGRRAKKKLANDGFRDRKRQASA